MLSQSDMPQSLSTLFSAYASLAASVMLVRSMANDFIPYELRSYLSSAIHYLFNLFLPSTLTLVIEEFSGLSRNQIYDAAQLYLRTKIGPSANNLLVSKTAKQRTISVSIDKGEEVKDVYDKIVLTWQYVCSEKEHNGHSDERRCFQLTFKKKFKETVMDSYLPYVLAKGKAIKEEDTVIKIYNRDFLYADQEEASGGGMWGSINLEHPATFETLAMDSALKKMIIEDLERFLQRKEFYKKVGKAWKRGYLLYGPPGTGKSSLIAAMANYLKFDIYDLELTSIYSDSDLRRILLSTTNRSILVIEDIDCSLEVQDRRNQDQFEPNSKLTLSGLLNFIDGLWSSCGDERIIVFTTNHKDRLDPALLRPGRMDMHINMTYCSTEAIHILVSNYLNINVQSHRFYSEIEGLIEKGTNITPAEVAEELMRSEDADVCLEGVVWSLKRKNSEANKLEEGNGGEESEKLSAEQVEENNAIVNNNKKKIKSNSCIRFMRGFKSSTRKKNL